jgi:hypothetical protein
MAKEHKGIAMVILGVIAIVAIVGLILLFVNGKNATGQGIYGGAIKQVSYPYWEGRGTPRNLEGAQPYWPTQASKDMTTNWNFIGAPKRNPQSDIPAPLRKCGTGCFLVPVNEGLPETYMARGYSATPMVNQAGVCICPPHTMIGGIAGST